MYEIIEAHDGWDVLDEDGKAAGVAMLPGEVSDTLLDEGLSMETEVWLSPMVGHSRALSVAEVEGALLDAER